MKQLKQHFFYAKRVFFEYDRGWYYYGPLYLWMRYWIAPKILKKTTPISREANVDHLSIHILTGRKEMTMAVWSLASWYAVAEIVGELYIHSDGTLTDADKATFARLFPHATIVDTKDFLRDYGDQLNDWPVIKKFRETYSTLKFQQKKLVDMYMVSDKECHLLIDTDLVWFSRPDELEDAIKEHCRYSYMSSDGDGPYAYVTFKNGERLSDELAKYNSGILLYNKNHFDWDKFTEYLESIDYLNTKFTDQACFAYSLGSHLRMLSRDKYVIKRPVPRNVVVRHYTGPSRAKFYCYGINFIYKKLLK